MLWNYFRITIRHAVKSKLASAANVAGLAIGLAACILIALYVQDELSYDTHWADGDRIYRVNTTLDSTGTSPGRGIFTSAATLPALRQFFAQEIEHGARVATPLRYEIRVGAERFFNEVVAEVDRELLEIFDLEVLAGSLGATLDDPTSIALSSEVAARFFPGQEALGRTVTLATPERGARDYRVGAVYRLPDGNTVLDLPAMIRLDLASSPYLTKDFLKPVLLANLVAWPLAWLIAQRWLEGFAYRIDLGPLYFVGGTLLALAIAAATVGVTAARAAALNPIHSLRYE